MVSKFIIVLFLSGLLLVGCAKGDEGCFSIYGVSALSDCDNPSNDPEKQNLCLLWLSFYQQCKK